MTFLLTRRAKTALRFVLVVPTFTMMSFALTDTAQAASSSAATSQADLRVYGKVTAAFGSHRVLFTCEDAKHADILLGKLLADFFWDAGKEVQETNVNIGSQSLMIREWPPYGAVLVARIGANVLAIGGDSVAGVIVDAKREPLLHSGKAVALPLRPYPRALDFYDLRAFKFYTSALASPRGYGWESHWPFVHSLGLDSMSFQSLNFDHSTPAPGVVQWGPSDSEIREAEKENGVIVPSVEVAGGMPFWMRNQFPEAMAQASPSTLMSGWHTPALSERDMQSWGMPLELQRKYSLNFLREVMERYGRSEAIGGWQIYAGGPGVELGYHNRLTEKWDYSPEGETSFRNYLRRIKGYSLSELGQRWFGDAKHFSSWQQVSIPDVNGFFGDLDSESYPINTGWQWLQQNQADQGNAIPSISSKWIAVNMPPSQQQITFPEAPSYYKVSFDPSKWITARPSKHIYMVCDHEVKNAPATKVWLNGEYLGEYKTKWGRIIGNYRSFDVDITGKLRKGTNELVLLVPGIGKIMGPVFLTADEPHYYPYLGAKRNAQYVDVMSWQPYGLYSIHDTIFRAARHLDPDHPMILASDEFGFMGKEAAALACNYGLSIQMTGRESWYFPWWSGLGLVDGFYATSEPSITPSVPDMTRMLSWILYDGDSSTMLFWNIEDFIKMQSESGWFTKYQREIHLEGKAQRVQPKIAIFRSNVTDLLNNLSTGDWDIGRGELESAHFDNVYVTEREILNGKVNAYPILFDSGSLYTDPQTISAIRHYVEAGGTFVALHNTGWNTITTSTPESFPIAQLTGFHVISASHKGELSFGDNLPIFQAWSGRRFQGDGLSLEPSAPGAVSIAKWKDGSTALGYRRLGKGRVLVLGSTFWRDSKMGEGSVYSIRSDVEREFLDRLFTDLGMRRITNSSSTQIWTRKFVTKNGLQNWLIAINAGSGTATGSVSMKIEKQPEKVWDIVSHKSVPFTFADGEITIPGISIPERESRVFAVRRADLVDGIPVWWGEKLSYWQNLPLSNEAISIASDKTVRPADPTGLDTIAVNRWKFHPVTNPGTDHTDWRAPGFDDSGWITIQSGLWNLQSKQLESHKGVGEYRFSFYVPKAWSGHRVKLGLFYDSAPIAFGRSEFSINGHHVVAYNAEGCKNCGRESDFDITGHLQKGENVLSAVVDAGGNLGGITGAVWLAPEPILTQPKDILSGWDAMSRDRRSVSPTRFPGKSHGEYLAQTVDIPSSWAGKNVFLHLESASPWIVLIMINGHPFYESTSGAGFANRVDINLAPFFRAGAPNRIELWPSTVGSSGDGNRSVDMDISVARIGISNAGVNSAQR